jgi:hypothetical protein
MTIEAAVRQTEISHEIPDTSTLPATGAKPAGGGADDALARLLLVIRGLTHSYLR